MHVGMHASPYRAKDVSGRSGLSDWNGTVRERPVGRAGDGRDELALVRTRSGSSHLRTRRVTPLGTVSLYLLMYMLLARILSFCRVSRHVSRGMSKVSSA